MATRAALIEAFNRNPIGTEPGGARWRGWVVAEDDFPNEISAEFWPEEKSLFRALELIAPENVRFLILGQDPYPDTHTKLDGTTNVPNAIGVAFAVDEDRTEEIPDSLKAILEKVYLNGRENPTLADWIESGVLLLNAALTVPKADVGQKPGEMSGKHLPLWRDFTASIIGQLKRDYPDVKLIAFGSKAREAMCDGLERAGVFSSCNHPSRPHVGGKRSFSNFWDTPAGQSLPVMS